jgi:hypothetical protein
MHYIESLVYCAFQMTWLVLNHIISDSQNTNDMVINLFNVNYIDSLIRIYLIYHYVVINPKEKDNVISANLDAKRCR